MQFHSAAEPVKSGRDRHLAFCFLPLSVFAVFAAAIVGRGYWLLLVSAFLMLAVPLLDLLTGWQDEVHFETNEFNRVEKSLLGWSPRLFVLLHMGFVIYLAASIERFDSKEKVMAVVSCSLLGGICFAAAHELLHSKGRIDQVLQRIVTVFLFYPHYKLIHIRSHHVHTSTDNDENTAWLNETIYSYIARTIPGSAIRCWELETRQRLNRSVAAAVLRNPLTWQAAGQLLVLAIVYWLLGPLSLAFYAVQALGSHIVLESVNYIQHYGLIRDRRGGEYAKTGPEHSWDTYHFFSSYMTFRVGHHSYHHIAVKPYYALASEPDAPKLPVGYFWAIPIVFLPPWWKRVIHPRLNHRLAQSGAQPA